MLNSPGRVKNAERHISYVNPCVKYVMFAFNFLFWVSNKQIILRFASTANSNLSTFIT